ncbi:MAG: hypothetical protein IPQ07_04865 [Myxococcales bacterium]|nr:hypothetical protein [Myxococcales bacterium]
MADDAGALLVRSGLVTTSALDDARARMEASGGTIGEQLVVLGALTDDVLTDFYRSRLLVPQVNPNTLARLPIKVVAAIPSDMAIELRAIPVGLDAENNLTVAMSDPSDRHAVDEITFFTGAYVVRAVATQMQIAWCLAHYYGHVTALGQRLMQSTGAAAPVSAPVARTKGLTGQVEAMRHRGVAPVTGPVNLARPRSGEIVVPTTATDSTPKLEAPPPSPEPIREPVRDEPVRAVSQPEVPDTDGIPKPRARSVSGEIRVPGRRAPSIRPAMPEALGDEDESGPVITVEVLDAELDDDATGPHKPAPVRKRKAKSDPPELYARAGEVDISTGPVRKIDLEEPRIIIAEQAVETMAVTERSGELRARPRPEPLAAPSRSIEITDDTSAAVMIHEQPDRGEPSDRESQPILLDRRRASDPPATVTSRAPSPDHGDHDDNDDVVVLDARKPSAAKQVRTDKRTQVGIGVLPAQTTRAHRDTEAGAIPEMVDDEPTGADTLSDDTVLTAPAPRGDDTSDETLAAPPSPDDTKSMLAAPPRPSAPRATSAAPSDRRRANTDVDDLDEDNGRTTSVMSVIELDEAIPQRSSEVVPAHLARSGLPGPNAKRIDHDEVDDGWGPPGTTIPPPLLGAVPGAHDDTGRGRIPVSNVEAAPLIVAPAIPPEDARSGAAQTPARALEEAAERAIELIRLLEHAHERDEVIDIMIDHLAETHRRAGFFVIKRDELSVFSIEPPPHTMPFATLHLGRASTLQDVVRTRLPYRGPVPDEASRQFLTMVLGMAPPEILLVPIAVRERVVGVLFAENRSRHTFDDQLAFASRAAGMALERILKTKRG